MNSEERNEHAVGPLEGLRVLDLAGEIGIYCTKLMADLGADVIKVEKPDGDETRDLPPFFHDEPDPRKSLFFQLYNTSKRGITLELSSSDGRELFKKLAAKADIIVETFRPGHMENLGLGYETLEKLNKGLVMASITPFGQTGPYRDYKASDLTGGAMGGIVYTTGEPDREPLRPGGSEAYHMASYIACMAILIAVNYRDISGSGQHIDVSMQEAIAGEMESYSSWFLYQDLLWQRYGAGIPHVVPSNLFPCKDGYVHIISGGAGQWPALVEWIGDERLLDPKFVDGKIRIENRELVDTAIGEWTSNFTRQELFHEGQRRRIPIGPCQNAKDIAEDPHLAARGFFVEIEHPELGHLTYPGAPYIFHETPWKISRVAPSLREHNKEIYCGELGLSPEELVMLKVAGTI